MGNKNSILILCIVLLITLLPGVVSAEVLHPEMVDFNKTMAYSDLGLSGPSDIQIWVGNQIVETGNTTAGVLYQPLGDFTVVQKPSLANRWTGNPLNMFNDLTGFLFANFTTIFVMLGMVAVAVGLASFGRRH